MITSNRSYVLILLTFKVFEEECDNDQEMTTSHETCSRDEVGDGDFEDAGPSSQGHRKLGENQLKKRLPGIPKGAAKSISGYFGVHKSDKSKKVDPWKLYMTLPIPSDYHEPGKSKSKLKFLGFFPSAEAAGRVHDQVAYHVLGRRQVLKHGTNII